MPSKSTKEIRESLHRGNDDLTAEGMVNSAIETLLETRALDRLADHQPSLVNELRKQSIAIIEKNKEIQQLIRTEIERRSAFNKVWRKNKNRIGNRTTVLVFLVQIYCVFLSALAASYLSAPITNVLFGSTNIIVRFEQTSLYLASFYVYLPIVSIVFFGLRSRKNLWFKESELVPNILRPSRYFFYAVILYLVGIPFFFMFLPQFGILPNGLQNAGTSILLLAIVSASIAIYYFSQRSSLLSLPNDDSKAINIMLEQERLSRVEHFQRIDRRVLEVTSRTAKDIEKQHNLHVDRWSTILPPYGSEESWTNLGEYYDTYVDTDKQHELRDTIEYGQKGSFGIAGERGAGKTAMMKELEREFSGDDAKGVLTVWISAPTSVNDRELPISILAKVASKAGAYLSGNSSWPDIPPEKLSSVQNKTRTLRQLALFSLCLAVVMGIVMLARVFLIPEQLPWASNILSEEIIASDSVALLFVSLVGTSIVALSYGRRIRSNSGRFASSWHSRTAVTSVDRPLVAASADVLEKLWYERKDSLSSNVSMSERSGNG